MYILPDNLTYKKTQHDLIVEIQNTIFPSEVQWSEGSVVGLGNKGPTKVFQLKAVDLRKGPLGI